LNQLPRDEIGSFLVIAFVDVYGIGSVPHAFKALHPLLVRGGEICLSVRGREYDTGLFLVPLPSNRDMMDFDPPLLPYTVFQRISSPALLLAPLHTLVSSPSPIER
jgi:hypothetical protein